MGPDFLDRFAGPTAPGQPPPLSLQLLFADPLDLTAGAVSASLRDYHPDLREAAVELVPVASNPLAARAVSADGPPAALLGLIEWGRHRVKLIGCDAPMPYGPVEACVGPAMIPPPMKVDAKQHRSHVLLYYAGTDPDPLEQYVSLAAVAGALGRFNGIVVMNEEARAAVPALDLIPEPGEEALRTLRSLPVPYLWGGFVKLDVGDPARPWVRTFACHRLGLPDLALHLTGHDRTSRAFQLFSGLLGYLTQTGEAFAAGDTIDLGEGTPLRLREPTDDEWYLESPGTMLVVEEG